MEETARVRQELGYPIMVTPYSQFVGVQAAMNVILGERYKEVTDESIHYALGTWGAEESSSIDDDIKDKILNRPQAREPSIGKRPNRRCNNFAPSSTAPVYPTMNCCCATSPGQRTSRK